MKAIIIFIAVFALQAEARLAIVGSCGIRADFKVTQEVSFELDHAAALNAECPHQTIPVKIQREADGVTYDYVFYVEHQRKGTLLGISPAQGEKRDRFPLHSQTYANDLKIGEELSFSGWASNLDGDHRVSYFCTATLKDTESE